MSRGIKFRYVIRHLETGNIITFEKPISEIERYGSLEWMCNMVLGIEIANGYELVSRDQFTGLLDKNGNEIYEGDILTYDYADNKEVKDWMVKAHFIVRYEKDYIICGTDVKPERKCFLHGFRFKFTEVLGNTHSNPELL